MRRSAVVGFHTIVVPLGLFVFILATLFGANGRTLPITALAAPQLISPQAIADPIDCNIASSLFAGVDVSQGQDPNDAATFLTDLENDGFEVGTFDLGSGIPACLDVMLVFGLANGNLLDGVYPATQGTTLLNWVNSGGGLMLFGEWGFLKANTEPLFQAFGYAQQGDDAAVVSDPTDSDPTAPAIVSDTWVVYQNDNFLPHPALSGVTSVELLRSSWLNSSANSIVQTDNDAAPAVVPVMAAFVQGSGCVMLSADTNWVGEIDAAYQKEDNALFARQMASWLTGCNTLSLLKQADVATASPGEQVMFTMTAVNNQDTAVSGIVITDTIPVGTSFVNASASFTGPDTNGVVSWVVGTLATGEQTAVTLTVQINADNSNSSVDNTAWLLASQTNPLQATTSVAILNQPPLAAPDLYLPLIAHDFCIPSSNYSDISLIIDVSGSMNSLVSPGGSTKLEAAQEAAIDFVNLLTFPGDQAAVVTFGSNAQLVHSLSADRNSLINAIQDITINGASRIDLGLRQGHAELNSPRHIPVNQTVIVILTDGLPSEVEPAEVIAAADEAKADDIRIYAIGLGSDVNPTLMQAIATDANTYYFAPSAAELREIYDQIATDIYCQ